MSEKNDTGAIANPWRQILRQRSANLLRAYRGPISPGCLIPADVPPPSPTVQRNSLLHVPIDVFTAGDNLVIPTLIGKKLIYELVIWNVTAQTLALYQGPSATGIRLLRLTDFPDLTGFTLGFNGNFTMPHFEVDSGQPLVLNLQNSTQVDGFIKYRSEATGDF